jgi:DNA-binding MarR family transcriptional regulator
MLGPAIGNSGSVGGGGVRPDAQEWAVQPGPLEARLAAAAERLGHAARLLLRAAAARHGVSIIQAQLLLRLAGDATGASSNIGALTQWFDVRQPTVSDAVGALERKSFVVKTRSGGRQRLELSPAGRAAAADLATWDVPLRAAFAGSPPDPAGAALAVMLEAIAGLHATGVVTVAGSCTTCRFFRPSMGEAAPHHCALLDMPLRQVDLRVDCPDHRPVAA